MRFERHLTALPEAPDQAARYRAEVGEDFVEYTVPKDWSRHAAQILMSDVFFKQALPTLIRKVPEDNVPEWLWRSEVDEAGLEGVSAEWRYRFETDIRDVLHRVAGALTYHGWKAGYFNGDDDAKIFYAEFYELVLQQRASPEMALLATGGLEWAYGLKNTDGYVPRQAIASFGSASVAAQHIPVITPERDYFRKIQALDRSGAAKRVVMMPVENIDSANFAGMKRQSDIDSTAKDLGLKMLRQALHHVMDACDRNALFGFDPDRNLRLARAVTDAKNAGVDEAAIALAIDYAQQGYEEISFLNPSDDDELKPSVVPVLSMPDSFVEAAMTGHGFLQYEAGEPKRHIAAASLFDHICETLWFSGAPEVFFRDRAASPALLMGQQGRSNSGGFVFAPDSVAPSGVLNILKLPTVADIEHAATIMTVALDAASYLCAASHTMRPVVLGMTNVATCLMARGLAYDSDAARAEAALIAALITSAAEAASASLAAASKPFDGYAFREKEILQVVKDRIALISGSGFGAKGMAGRGTSFKAGAITNKDLMNAARAMAEKAYNAIRDGGLRNAHVTAIDTEMPLHILLGGQTRDITPEAALVRFEGYFSDTLETAELYGKKLNPAVPQALQRLGYTAQAIDDIHFYAVGHGTLLAAPGINHATLRAKGFHQGAIDALEAALKTAQHIRYVFNRWTLGSDFCRHMLGFSSEDLDSGTFDMLLELGFTEDDIDDANLYCCGTMTLEGAPHLKPAHLDIFDCTAPSGFFAIRRVAPEAHIKMQAAIEPFISGAIAHTVEVNAATDIGGIQKLILDGFALGVKNLKIFRLASSLRHAVLSKNALVEEDDMISNDDPASLFHEKILNKSL